MLFMIIFLLQQQQRPDLSRLMQLQAAGAGLPTSMAAAGGLPPGFLQAGANPAAAASALAAAGLPGIQAIHTSDHASELPAAGCYGCRRRSAEGEV